MMFSLLRYTFCLHFYLINIHIFDYPDSRLSGLFTEVLTSPDTKVIVIVIVIVMVMVMVMVTVTVTVTVTVMIMVMVMAMVW